MGVLSGAEIKALSLGERPLICPYCDEVALEEALDVRYKEPKRTGNDDYYCLHLDADAELIHPDDTRERITAAEKEDGTYVFVLTPGASVIVRTVERVTMPAGLFGIAVPHIDYVAQGVRRFAQIVPPGFTGPVPLHLHNDGKAPIELSLYRGIAHLVVCRMETDGAAVAEGLCAA